MSQSSTPPPSTFKLFLFAASRIYKEGKSLIHLISPKFNFQQYVDEDQLKKVGAGLGDFVHAEKGPAGFLVNFNKTEHTAKLKVTVDGDLAYIENIRATLVESHGDRLFENPIVSCVWCGAQGLPLGMYHIRIRALYGPALLQNGKTARFEGGCPVPIIKTNHPSGPSTIGKGFSEVGTNKGKPIIGKGFEEVNKSKEIIGKGFQEAKTETLRAVVMSSMVNKAGTRTHFLWILDKLEEGIFNHENEHRQGHVFDGLFRVDPKNGKLTCQQYKGQCNTLKIDGGLDEKKRIWFEVEVKNYQPKSFNMRFPCAEAEFFGEIIDTEELLKESDANGKKVKIQRRRGEVEKIYSWFITDLV